MDPLLFITLSLGFIFLMTCLGAATVFFFRKGISENFQQVFLGFAAGVMIAASVWSLLLPAIEETQNSQLPGWVTVSGGFILGVLFLFALDHLIPHLHPVTNIREGAAVSSKRTTLLITAVTLHNIPEGMAVGLSLALAAQHDANAAMSASAAALAIGIGIQNFPEGAAIALPLRQGGVSSKKAFGLGCGSGAVEPLFGFLTIALAGFLTPAMPWLLSFAAGAMIYVVVEELIPEARLGKHSHVGTMSVMAGFLLMMILDMALG